MHISEEARKCVSVTLAWHIFVMNPNIKTLSSCLPKNHAKSKISGRPIITYFTEKGCNIKKKM